MHVSAEPVAEPGTQQLADGTLRRGVEWRQGVDCPPLPVLLLRPFIDLEPCSPGPLYARGIEQYWNAFTDARQPRFSLQSVLPAIFRAQFLSEIGLRDLAVEDPRQVPTQFRSARWDALCAAVDGWQELSADRKCRVVLLLHALCFYAVILSLVPDIADEEVATGRCEAELTYWRASALYMWSLRGPVTDYASANLAEIERVARLGPRVGPVAVNAVLRLLVHAAKTGAPADRLRGLQAQAEQTVGAVVGEADAFTRGLLLSRYYRAAAFVPLRQGLRADVIRMMDLAEQYAVSLAPSDETQELIRLENLHPVLESRTKEALWLGDLDLALSRARSVVDLDPYDPKTWLELGQVRLRRGEIAEAAESYAVAATLGPPASAIARHMAGVCYRDLGQPMLAGFFFKEAVEVDRHAISPHDEIQALSDIPVLSALKAWSLRSFES